MRYTDSSASYGYYRSLLKCLMVAFEDGFNRFDSLGHSNIGQEYHSRVRNPSQVDHFSDVLVHCDENAVLCPRPFQQCPVAWIRIEGLCLNHIVTVIAQPFCQPASGASIYQEPHGGGATDTRARVSPAITAWA
jgi:hypothetical protein